jgi:hypothetical protein
MFSLANLLKSSLVAALVVVAVLGSGASASAATRVANPGVSNCMSSVCTNITLGYNGGFEDACLIRNTYNYAVIAYVAVSPWPYGSVGTLGPIVLGIFDERRVFAWTPGLHDWRTYSCRVISVQ